MSSTTTDADVPPKAVGDASEPVILQILPEDKKADIREKMWHFMDKNQLSPIYSPFGKIPNFKDTDAAGEQLTTLDVFKAATTVKVDPDKPLQSARFAALKAGKTLLVPTPRHRPGLLTKLTLPENCDDDTLTKCATRQGVAECSAHIELDDPIKIDLLVVGCVAVSPKGWRIGKGSGFSDLEYAMLVSNGAMSPSVPVVTVVHDSQVVDLPESLFDIHDVAVDYIVTPTRVIKCIGAKPRPASIIWSLLAPERLERLQILKRLRYREWKAEKDVRLSGETDAPTELTDELPSPDDRAGYPRRRNNYRKKPRKPRTADDDAAGDVIDDRKIKDGSSPGERRGRGGGRIGYRRFRRRGGPRREGGENHRTSSGGENGESDRDEERDEGREGGHRSGTAGRRRRYGGPREGGGRPRREPDSQPEDDDEGKDGEGGNDKDGVRTGGRRPRRRSRRSESDGGGGASEGDNRRGGGTAGRRRNFRPSGSGRPYYGDCEGSVYVGALPKFLRVSEFKAEVRDRNVQPLRVVWRGASGYAFLGFRTVDDAEQALEALAGLHIDEHDLRLEMAKSSGVRRRRRGVERSGDSGGGDDHVVTSEDE